MLSLSTYIMKIGQIRWYMSDQQAKDIEQMAHIHFQKQNDYFLISKVKYSPYDILLALEDIDFTLEKKSDDLSIKILKI